ncbi:hypothetical protein P692DRAFT_20871723 [Suillus brevipes Sb2]|nr:hypothetical protein P692DRAFT_20871723 [Suillus brevipes Sb2]
MDTSTTAPMSRREPSSPATTPPPEDLIESPPTKPIPRPRPIKSSNQHTSSSSSPDVPPAPPARALAPITKHVPKLAETSKVSHTTTSKKHPSADLLDDSDSPLTDEESVAPSPAKRSRKGKRAPAVSSKSAGKKCKGRK